MNRRKFLTESGVLGAGVAAVAAIGAARPETAQAQARPYTTEEPSAFFELDALLNERQELDRLYHSFLRVPGLHMGIYHLVAGAADPQSPHTEDEAYLVLEGAGRIRVEDKVYPIKKGSVIYVEAQATHKFDEITEDLTLLVFFASDKPNAS